MVLSHAGEFRLFLKRTYWVAVAVSNELELVVLSAVWSVDWWMDVAIMHVYMLILTDAEHT